MVPRYSARLSPLQAETHWSLEGQVLVQRRGSREQRFDLARLKALRAAGGGVILAFGLPRLTIPAQSYGEALRPVDQSESFHAFMVEVARIAAIAAPNVVTQGTSRGPTEALVWIIGLIGGGALALLVISASVGAWALGLALAARMIFVMILAFAVLPWLRRSAR